MGGGKDDGVRERREGGGDVQLVCACRRKWRKSSDDTAPPAEWPVKRMWFICGWEERRDEMSSDRDGSRASAPFKKPECAWMGLWSVGRSVGGYCLLSSASVF